MNETKSTAQELIKREFVELLIENYEKQAKELEKYKAAIGYFQREGTQVEKDIVKNLLSY